MYHYLVIDLNDEDKILHDSSLDSNTSNGFTSPNVAEMVAFSQVTLNAKPNDSIGILVVKVLTDKFDAPTCVTIAHLVHQYMTKSSLS